ncbi:ribosome maturation factor RimP [Natranaerobius trueperi]|uniref:Ribosome maturation factor RimP n=1 Tax=Natranaerobius trueperi TaxID=759412 RepID=A0A226BZP6_9FIRM|nr:ribosome maturation factor RimP [Natranaerobius trueperi]OWZ84272.1 ribosome maturation factor RimP [Natranaerobius trueperi]
MVSGDKLESLIEPAVNELGYELVDVELTTENQRAVLRVYIDTEGGITLDDCETVSNSLDELLDEHDPIPHSYVLEVSSPGAERPLRKKKDFIYFAGKSIQVKTYMKLDGRKNFKGKLIGLDGDDVIVDTYNDGEVKIPLEKIAKANLLLDF